MRPEITDTPEAPKQAQEKLDKVRLCWGDSWHARACPDMGFRQAAQQDGTACCGAAVLDWLKSTVVLGAVRLLVATTCLPLLSPAARHSPEGIQDGPCDHVGSILAGSLADGLTLSLLAWVLHLSPPSASLTNAPEFPAQLAGVQMGPMSRDEKIMTAVMLGAVIMWVAGDSLGIASVVAAMLGLSALLLTGVLTWRDCLTYSQVLPEP